MSNELHYQEKGREKCGWHWHRGGTMARVDEVVMLDDGIGRVEILPAWGGGVRHYDVQIADGLQPVFRPDASRRGMFALGLNVLLPFSNRISGGGFHHDGAFHPLAPNIDGNPLPTHGNAFQQVWTVTESAEQAATLSLAPSPLGPFSYTARLAYRLEQGALSMVLSTTNTGPAALPFGAGFHPWFVRDPATRLRFAAKGYWTEDAAHLPEAFVSTDEGGFAFGTTGQLPRGWINLAFTGWNGAARIEWSARKLAVDIEALAPLTTAIVYSPSADADFVCFEPVSHSVDAHNRSDVGSAPPQLLQPGQVLTVAMVIRPSRLDDV